MLTLATWGADESLTWLKRIGEFQCAVRYAGRPKIAEWNARSVLPLALLSCGLHLPSSTRASEQRHSRSRFRILCTLKPLLCVCAGASWGTANLGRHPGAALCWTPSSAPFWSAQCSQVSMLVLEFAALWSPQLCHGFDTGRVCPPASADAERDGCRIQQGVHDAGRPLPRPAPAAVGHRCTQNSEFELDFSSTGCRCHPLSPAQVKCLRPMVPLLCRRASRHPCGRHRLGGGADGTCHGGEQVSTTRFSLLAWYFGTTANLQHSQRCITLRRWQRRSSAGACT